MTEFDGQIYTRGDLERARLEALEEAAKACEGMWDLRDDERARMHAAKCASAIRALALQSKP